MCAGKKKIMSGAFLQHLGTKFCFVNLSNLSYSTKRATDGEVCVLKGWRATAECLWCQFYPFVIRQRGKMLMRAKLGVCFYQRVACFTAPWLSISHIGYSKCLSPSSPFFTSKWDKHFPGSAITRFPRWCVRTIHNLPADIPLPSEVPQQVQETTCDRTQLPVRWRYTLKLLLLLQSSSLWHLELNYLFFAFFSRFNTTFFTDRQRN